MVVKTKYYCGRDGADDLRYQKHHTQQVGCDFCRIGDPDNTTNTIVEEDEMFWVVENAYPYAIFYNDKVISHLLIVPKKHVEGIAELTAGERQMLIELISKYETEGHLFLGRSPNDSSKSMAHQHTHLIKTTSLR
jgi:diadenosine tetraphosphate (Ap4A) HIT family hydrolase